MSPLLMQIRYTKRATAAGEPPAPLQEASALLENVLGRAIPQVRATWDANTDPRGQAVYTLSLATTVRRAEASFSANELASRSLARTRYLHLWGDLVRDAFEEQSRREFEVRKRAGERLGVQICSVMFPLIGTIIVILLGFRLG